jgi:hypothetical protein
MPFSRRTALQLALAAWAHAEDQAHQHQSPPATQTPYTFRFFLPAEVATLRRYAAVLIPPSSRSGGASAAQVEQYIDFVLASAAPSLQRSWRNGLGRFARQSDAFSLLSRLAPREFQPSSRDEHFFVLLKAAVTTAFYTSEEGILKELGYQGMGFLREFPGDPGQPFNVPSSYKPLLRARS